MTNRQRYVVLMLASTASLFGQGVPVLKRGNVELGGFAAFTFGGSATVPLDFSQFGLSKAQYSPPQSNGGGGVHAGVALSKHVMLYGEYAFLTGGKADIVDDAYNRNAPAQTRVYANAKNNSTEFEGGVEVRFETRKAPKLVPYFSVGAGIVRTSGSLSQGSIGSSPPGPQSTFSGVLHATNIAANGGGGVRYFFTEHAGLRVEAKGFAGDGDLRFGRLVFGLFYQFH